MNRALHAALVAGIFLISGLIGIHIVRELYLMHAVSTVAYVTLASGLIGALIAYRDFRTENDVFEA